uniref:Uncharacterized protein n=1 Tax=Plectus sambesii TaxID=2011161 RepID=A0A914WRF1_9BILA
METRPTDNNRTSADCSTNGRPSTDDNGAEHAATCLIDASGRRRSEIMGTQEADRFGYLIKGWQRKMRMTNGALEQRPRYLKDGKKYFERRGLSGPKPHFIWGNFPKALSGQMHVEMQRWTAEYGKNYGMFHGSKPVLVTSDLAVINDVFQKQFNSFHSRYKHPLAPNPDTVKEMHMFGARGLRWKRLRTIANPTFSVAKIKEMMPIFTDSINTLVGNLKRHAESNKPFDIYPYYKYLTGDVIARCALGQESSIQDESNDWVRMFNEGLGTEFCFKNMPVAFLAWTFPELKQFWRIVQQVKDALRVYIFRNTRLNSIREFLAKLRADVEMRQLQKDENHGKKDFIQLFVEAQTEEPLEKEVTEVTDGKLLMQQLKISKKLTTGEIVQQCLLFMLAGYDTTANSLSYITYLLAKHQDVQDKLISEIDAYCPDEADVTYETLHEMTYLNLVVKEGLRLFPLAAFVQSRQAVADCEVGGIPVQKGTGIMIDVWSVHRNREVWGADAEDFRPERFESDEDEGRPSLAYIPFGVGPRMCIGMRFALLEEKMAIVRLLQNFRFVATDATKLDMKLSDPGTVSPDEVIVRLEPRQRSN